MGRYILQEPKFGGLRCEGVEEVEKCNEHSCDVDCELEEFSNWGPCTSACGGGYQEKRRALIKRQQGKGGQAACQKRHVVSACEAAKLKAHTFGVVPQPVLTAQQGVFVDSIVA